MSLPVAWVERIFDKLSLVYGKTFLNRWEGIELQSVKTDWGHELDGYQRFPEAIAWALQNLPDRAPTVIEFRGICRRAPAAEVPRIEAPKADPARVAAELRKLAPLREAPRIDSRDWARRLIQRHECGAYPSTLAALKMAREALEGFE